MLCHARVRGQEVRHGSAGAGAYRLRNGRHDEQEGLRRDKERRPRHRLPVVHAVHGDVYHQQFDRHERFGLTMGRRSLPETPSGVTENQKEEAMKIGFSVSGLCVILFLIFMILKLCGVIAWAWAIICIPLYVLAAMIVLKIVIVVLCALFLKD